MKTADFPYQYSYRRFPTREVMIGNISIGAANPIRIQSMVNTPPEDINATVRQIIGLSEAGCELVRLTVPSVSDAHNLKKVKRGLALAGVQVPLVADVHFNPRIAEIAAEIVEKVRINPGNYRKPGSLNPERWDASARQRALEETEELLLPLMDVCRKNRTAIRIGSNHGSLSPRIMEQFGDTPHGMVEAAMEFVRIFSRHDFHDMVISMKSSNVRVMVQAYRLLVSAMSNDGLNYPLHLGVTEAGFGTEGRIKSAAGIGLLLDEGIGDTIRVSLTEDPVEEIPVAKMLIKRYSTFTLDESPHKEIVIPYDPHSYKRRESIELAAIGNLSIPVVIGTEPSDAEDERPDFIVAGSNRDSGIVWSKSTEVHIPVISAREINAGIISGMATVALLLPEDPDDQLISELSKVKNVILVLQTGLLKHTGSLKAWIALFEKFNIRLPVVLKINCEKADYQDVIINAPVVASALLIDGLADGLWIDSPAGSEPNRTAYQILQATRARITTTEYISCPSCGRTRFDIQDAVRMIRKKTEHLTGLKIAVMGCIVNGPGEMADADYGYVGAGNGTVTLYKGKEAVMKSISEDIAVEALKDLIKRSGDWKEPL